MVSGATRNVQNGKGDTQIIASVTLTRTFMQSSIMPPFAHAAPGAVAGLGQVWQHYYRHNASCQLLAEHLLPALLCNTVRNGSMGVVGVVACLPVEPSIAELFAQETVTARCLWTVCEQQFQ